MAGERSAMGAPLVLEVAGTGECVANWRVEPQTQLSKNSEAPDVGTIEIKLDELTQLFNSLDPSPFPERDLDDEAEAYIIAWARELGDRPLRIVVHLPEREAHKAREIGIEKSLANYFTYRAGMEERKRHELLRVGRRSLAVGIAVLAICTSLAHLLRAFGAENDVAQFLAEGLIIFGWVANWRPAEIFLYDIWEIGRSCRLYRRLAEADIEVVVRDGSRRAAPN